MGEGRPFKEDQKDFYYSYGVAMALWAETEYEFGNLFIAMTGVPEKMGRAVFFSARSFLGRSDMFLAAVEHAKALPAAKTFLIDAMNHARSWQGVRNTLAHDMHGMNYQEGRDGGPFMAINPLKGPSLETPHVQRASESFFWFCQMVIHCKGRTMLVREPELCGELLALQPKDALQPSPDQMQLRQLLTRIQSSPD